MNKARSIDLRQGQRNLWFEDFLLARLQTVQLNNWSAKVTVRRVESVYEFCQKCSLVKQALNSHLNKKLLCCFEPESDLFMDPLHYYGWQFIYLLIKVDHVRAVHQKDFCERLSLLQFLLLLLSKL